MWLPPARPALMQSPWAPLGLNKICAMSSWPVPLNLIRTRWSALDLIKWASQVPKALHGLLTKGAQDLHSAKALGSSCLNRSIIIIPDPDLRIPILQFEFPDGRSARMLTARLRSILAERALPM